MIFGRVGERDEQGGDGARRNLGKRGGPSARHDGVSRRKRLAHAVLVPHEVPALRLLFGERERLGDRVELLRTRDVHHVHIGAGEQLVFERGHGLVDVARAEAAAKHEQHARLVGNAEHRATLLAAGGEHRGAHGIARHVCDPRIAHAVGRALVGDAHRRRALREVAVRHAHHRVLLVDHHGNAHALGRTRHRDGHVAAEADHHVGPDLTKPLLGGLRALRDLRHARDDGRRVVAVEARRFERRERHARRGHKARLDAARGAGEAHVAPAVGQHVRKGERRVDVTGGPAARQHCQHSDLPP